MEKGNYPTDLDSLFRIIDEEICCSEDSKKPLIGITTYTKVRYPAIVQSSFSP